MPRPKSDLRLISVNLPEADVAALDAFAAKKGLTRSALIRTAVIRLLR